MKWLYSEVEKDIDSIGHENSEELLSREEIQVTSRCLALMEVVHKIFDLREKHTKENEQLK